MTLITRKKDRPQKPETRHAGTAPGFPQNRQFYMTCLTVLGVVFGDIGTSPLYALRECFYGKSYLSPTPDNVLGVLSLVSWSLIAVVSCKYLLFVMRADNRGEGGILALMALLISGSGQWGGKRRALFWLGLFGASLLYGDGVITPAISVLSAVEGLQVATPALEPYVIPVTVLILVALFFFQKRGTAGIGSLFGPVMLIWFSAIAALGVAGIARQPQVLAAINPVHAAAFFLRNGWTGFIILGAVFLAVTGSEALYADMGHFGRRPISFTWFRLVFPALLINYFGQGALILARPDETTHPFYHLAPATVLYPLVTLATLATIIASQAVISGAFSLTRQAMQLGLSPRMAVIQTSPEEIGQVYIPAINWALMLTTILLVLGFRSSGNLASAYGVAVSTTMLITTMLIFFLTREKWHWNPLAAALVTLLFLTIDISFFSANMLKIREGGWFPLAAGVLVFTLMTTWRTGREVLQRRLREKIEPWDAFLRRISENPPVRVPGTAVFMTKRLGGTPPMLFHHLERNKLLHERALLVTVTTEPVPRISASELIEVTDLGQGFFRVILRYGFMQSPNVPVALRECEQHGLAIDGSDMTYYIERETLIPTAKRRGMALWRERLFSFMSRNALGATAFYQIPPGQVVEIGIQVEI